MYLLKCIGSQCGIDFELRVVIEKTKKEYLEYEVV